MPLDYIKSGISPLNPHLRAYTIGSEARLGRWIAGYNTARPHQALGYQTPDEIYKSPPVAGLAPTPIGVAA